MGILDDTRKVTTIEAQRVSKMKGGVKVRFDSLPLETRASARRMVVFCEVIGDALATIHCSPKDGF